MTLIYLRSITFPIELIFISHFFHPFFVIYLHHHHDQILKYVCFLLDLYFIKNFHETWTKMYRGNKKKYLKVFNHLLNIIKVSIIKIYGLQRTSFAFFLQLCWVNVCSGVRREMSVIYFKAWGVFECFNDEGNLKINGFSDFNFVFKFRVL